MLKRDIADELFSIAIRRYHEEKPEVQLTNRDMDLIWNSIYGKVQHEGREKALEYVKTAKLGIGKTSQSIDNLIDSVKTQASAAQAMQRETVRSGVERE